MSFITKRRLASMASASALIATMAVAAAARCDPGGGRATRPGSSQGRRPSPPSTSIRRHPSPGTIDATGYDIGVYFGPDHSGTVTADISGAKYYGVVADGANVNVTGSKVHDIGDNPSLDGPRSTACSAAVPSSIINGASGTISGNQVYDFQKNGIRSTAWPPTGIDPASPKTSASVSNNTVTGEGPIDYIAQNGIVISYGANATVKKNTVSGFHYTPDGHRGHGRAALSRPAASTSRTTRSPTTRWTSTTHGARPGGHVKP